MAVPTTIDDLSTTESSNSPAGGDSIGTALDDYLRAIQAIIKQNVSKGADIASGTTITIPDAGNYFVVTGTTGITGINDTWNGRTVILKFSGIVTLTDSAGLILFGSNITTAAGDVLTVVNESTGVYRAISLARAAGEYITAAGTDTLTNKTIVAANNTITTAASGDLAATELDAALAELDSEKAIKAAVPTLAGSNTFTGANIFDYNYTKFTGSQPEIEITPDTPTAGGLWGVNDGTHTRAVFGFYGTTGAVWLQRKSDAGAIETTFDLTDDGNVTVNGAAPTNADDLTRKDYVDLRALIASPTFTGVPAAPTAAATTDTTQIATTAFVQQEIGSQEVSAWCVFNGSTAGDNTPIAGHNISSVNRTATGRYTVNIDTDLDNTNYAVSLSSSFDTTYTGWLPYEADPTVNRTVGLFKMATVDLSSVDRDSARVTVVIYGGKT